MRLLLFASQVCSLQVSLAKNISEECKALVLQLPLLNELLCTVARKAHKRHSGSENDYVSGDVDGVSGG